MAKRRLESTERRLASNLEVKKIYMETIQSYVETGCVEQIDMHERNVKDSYYRIFQFEE